METIIQNKILFPEILWERPVHFYKAKAGKVLVLAGSSGMTGAAILSCEATFRSGTGILVLGFPDSLKDVYKEILPEAMTLALPSTPSGSLAKKAEEQILEQAKSCDVAVIGPGLSTNDETIHLIFRLLFELEIPIVLSSDGLTALAKGIEVMRSKENIKFMKNYFGKLKATMTIIAYPRDASHIITTIKAEGSKSKKFSSEYIKQHKTEAAQILSENLGVITVLAGNDAVITNPVHYERVQPFHNASEAIIINKSGDTEFPATNTGDVLSGIVGSFIAQNPDKIFESTATAVYLHGLAGKIAKEKIGERSVTASDVIRYLPEAIKKAEEKSS